MSSSLHASGYSCERRPGGRDGGGVRRERPQARPEREGTLVHEPPGAAPKRRIGNAEECSGRDEVQDIVAGSDPLRDQDRPELLGGRFVIEIRCEPLHKSLRVRRVAAIVERELSAAATMYDPQASLRLDMYQWPLPFQM